MLEFIPSSPNLIDRKNEGNFHHKTELVGKNSFANLKPIGESVWI